MPGTSSGAEEVALMKDTFSRTSTATSGTLRCHGYYRPVFRPSGPMWSTRSRTSCPKILERFPNAISSAASWSFPRPRSCQTCSTTTPSSRSSAVLQPGDPAGRPGRSAYRFASETAVPKFPPARPIFFSAGYSSFFPVDPSAGLVYYCPLCSRYGSPRSSSSLCPRHPHCSFSHPVSGHHRTRKTLLARKAAEQ